MNLSINGRMLIAALIILISFLGVTGLTLQRFFQTSAEDALKERLVVQLHALIASMEVSENGDMELMYALHETRFFSPGSGLYSQVLGQDNQPVWTSISMEGVSIPDLHAGLRRGQERYEFLKSADGVPLLVYSIGVTWGDDSMFEEQYTFVAAESLTRLNDQVQAFRKKLWGWLAAVTIVLLVMLTLILRWGLAPLRKAAEDVRAVEQGRRAELDDRYPAELRGLTENLNALIHTNREHELRYRASLGDLAHSLKTPLAVLRGSVEKPGHTLTELHRSVEEQIERMDQIVQYQLQRAAASGRKAMATPINVTSLVNKMLSALKKVHADKNLTCRLNIADTLEFRCDEADLIELVGNIVDNACKWGQKTVELTVYRELRGKDKGLFLEIADDGPGISEESLPTVLQRGGRLDQSISGDGLGLALVQDIVHLYEGRLTFGRSNLGGALVTVWLPGT